MKAYSKEAPKQVELISPETYRVRWDIYKAREETEDGVVEQYVCNECTVYAPLTQDSILQAAIRAGISQSEELKLINDYNAYTLGLTTDPMVVDRYKSYIGWRANLKIKIDTLCASNNIK
ncbi:hypothetical protein KNV38_gp096 [uncultured phage cr111_1]|uniref:Uncharacterized protein n=1 Tax=uncultured phage cr111_1 TaxID=2772071 RepID=A0A7M1RXN8_9CAUD|nr:hypothetical protein KNV38_gp096 [uncultured phage cr111_1]QOR59205.1 hypothetical protein [uncultured phage cr111_1]